MKRNNIEQLCEDMLNDDFVQLFYPIHFVQRILGRLRVNIQYKFVTAPSRIYQCYSCLLCLLSILSTIDAFLYCWTIFVPNITDFLLKMLIVTIVITNAIVVWQNNFQNGPLNSQLYVKLHNIDRKIQMHGSELINRKLTAPFIVSTVIVTIIGILWVFTFSSVNMQEFCFASMMAPMFGLGIYTDIILYIYMVYYIGIRVTYINSLLKMEPIEPNVSGILDKRIWMVTEFKKSGGENGGQVVVGVHSILEVLNDLLELYQLPVSGSKRYRWAAMLDRLAILIKLSLINTRDFLNMKQC